MDSENEDAWTWFLQKVEMFLTNLGKRDIISDSSSSIAKVVKRVYPQAHHGFCIVHLVKKIFEQESF